MGKPTNGTNAGFNIYQTNPFPEGKAPKIMIVTFTGIERTPYGVSQGAPHAPNRNFCPERVDCTGWWINNDEWLLNLDPSLHTFYLYSKNPPELQPLVFHFNNENQPNLIGDNDITDPETNCYVKGTIALSWMEHYGPDSAWFLMDAFGLLFDGPCMLEQIPQPEQKSILRFADQSDGTCIRIKLDKNWGIWLPTMTWYYNAETHDVIISLRFPKAMDGASTPAPSDFVLCNTEELLGISCTWHITEISALELHFTSLIEPTVDNWFNYTKGTKPLKFQAGGEYNSWNHMFFNEPIM